MLKKIAGALGAIALSAGAAVAAVDGPVAADASGRAVTATGSGTVVLGRALDTASAAGEYIRVKLGDAVL